MARRFLVAVVALLLFGGWLGGFAFLLRARPRATFSPGADYATVIFSPDSKLIATCGVGGPIQVRDASGRLLLSVADDWKPIQSVQFSPDASLIAAYQIDGDLKVWDCANGNVLCSLKPQTKADHAVRFRFTRVGNCLVVQDYSSQSTEDHVTFVDVATSQ